MNLDGKTLADWLRDQPIDKLSVRNFNYQANYAALASNLLPLHREVTTTANRVDGGYLTDHGPDHIRKLISRISDLLSAGEGSISAYEAYLLLCAAQFHDVGNIFGRDRHEEKSWEIMDQNRSTLPPDTVKRRLIYEIARAHGGDRKDKLSDMSRTYDVVSTTVRPQLLAAILKFADELAEDSSALRVTPPNAVCWRAARSFTNTRSPFRTSGLTGRRARCASNSICRYARPFAPSRRDRRKT